MTRSIHVIEIGRLATRAISSSFAYSRSNRCCSSSGVPRGLAKSLMPWITRYGRSRSTEASALSSTGLTSNDGVMLPPAVRWVSVLPIASPAAPSTNAWRKSACIIAISTSFAGSPRAARSPITYRRRQSCGTKVMKSSECGIASSTRP